MSDSTTTGPVDPLESPRNQQRLVRTLIDRLEAVPGVESAAAVLLPKAFDSPRLLAPRLDPPFDARFTVGTVVFNGNDVLAAVVVPISVVALAVFLKGSAVGVAIRASADSADRASLVGVPVKRLQTVVWVVAARRVVGGATNRRAGFTPGRGIGPCSFR